MPDKSARCHPNRPVLSARHYSRPRILVLDLGCWPVQHRSHRHGAGHPPRQHGHNRAEFNGKNAIGRAHRPTLGGKASLDRLPSNQAHPGQRRGGGPTYLARDNLAQTSPGGHRHMSGDRTVRSAGDARTSGRSVRHGTAGPGANRLAVVHDASALRPLGEAVCSAAAARACLRRVRRYSTPSRAGRR